MSPVREHNTQHEQAEELPLVTESARVTDVTALDRNRNDEVCREAARTLDAMGQESLVENRGKGEPPRVDWEGVRALVERDVPNSEKLEKLVERYERAYPSLLSVEFVAEEEPIDFVPGQYVTVRFHETPRPYSIASSPNEERLRLCIRRVPGGHLTPDLFEDLEPGDEITVRGPNGDFVLDPPSSRDLAFLATGTGVAPFRSMIDYTFEEERDVHEGQRRDVWLFLGSSWRDDLAYHDHFRALADERDNFHYVPTLSRENYLSDWDGETEYVQRTFVKYLRESVDADLDAPLADGRDADPDTGVEARIVPSNLEVYACGLSAMVETLTDVAKQTGVSETHIHGEGYG